MRALL
jgi:hypothetical protein